MNNIISKTKKMIFSPVDTIKNIDGKKDLSIAIVYLITAVLSSIVIVRGVINNIYLIIATIMKSLLSSIFTGAEEGYDFMSGMLNSFSGEAIAEAQKGITEVIDINKFSMYAVIVSLALIVLLIGVIFIINKYKFKGKEKITDIVTYVSFPLLIITIINIIALISISLYPPLFIVFMLLGLIMYFVLLYETLNSKLSIKSNILVYVVTLSFVLVAVVSALILMLV